MKNLLSNVVKKCPSPIGNFSYNQKTIEVKTKFVSVKCLKKEKGFEIYAYDNVNIHHFFLNTSQEVENWILELIEKEGQF